MFSILSRREIIILATFNLSSANAFNLVTSAILSFGKGLTISQSGIVDLTALLKKAFLTHSQTSASFYIYLQKSKSLKTLWDKEKLLITSNFYFSQCFLPFQRTCCHFHQIQNCRLQTLSVWKSLQFVVWERVAIMLLKEKILVTSIFSFSHNVFYPSKIKIQTFVHLFCRLQILSVWCLVKS